MTLNTAETGLAVSLGVRPSGAETPLSVKAVTSLEKARPLWERLEQEGSLTPYQTFAWCKAWFETLGRAEGARPLLIIMEDRARSIALVWPLAVSRRHGLTIASFPGGKHANYGMPLSQRGSFSRISGRDIVEALRTCGRELGISAFLLRQQPRRWDGERHPLLDIVHQASASSCWSGSLSADPTEMTARLMSAESLKKLCKKERKLAEFGAVSYGEAQTPAEIEAALNAFFDQKAARMAAMGLPDPFADETTRAFLKAAAAKDGDKGPALRLFSIRTGERIVALFGGVIHRDRFSGMITSFDATPDIARCSPGDLLLLHMATTFGARGMTTFDLGAGDGAYKKDYCPEEEPLFDVSLGVSAAGRLYAGLDRVVIRLRRQIKQSPRLMALLRPRPKARPQPPQ